MFTFENLLHVSILLMVSLILLLLFIGIYLIWDRFGLYRYETTKDKSSRELLLLDLLELIKKLTLVYSSAPRYNNDIVEALDELAITRLINLEGIYLQLVKIANIPNPGQHKKILNETILLAELIVRNYKYETWFTCHKRNSPHIIPMLKVGVCVKSDLGVSEINKELQLFSK